MPFEYTYERGEGRFKHCWNNDEAGFEPSPKGHVGKCHSSINDVVAEDLLKNGIPEIAIDEDSEFDFPERIFNVYRGSIRGCSNSARRKLSRLSVPRSNER
jgi:hypothetical protein